MASNWNVLTYTAKATAPTATPTTGALWYSSVVDEVDIMVHDGSKWDGYLNVYPATNATGPIVSASEPTLQSDGVLIPAFPTASKIDSVALTINV